MSIPSLYHDYKKYENLDKYSDDRILDLSDIPFIGPATLLPVYLFAKDNSIKKYRPHPYTKEHLDKIFGRTRGNDNLLPLLPVKLDSLHGINRAVVLGSVATKIRQMLFPDDEFGYLEYGDEGFKYIIDEILTNIEQHSEADRLFTYCQVYPIQGYIDVGILDNGLTIPGKYEESQQEFQNKNINPYLFRDDRHAIYKSVNGISTKEDFKRGLNSINREDELDQIDSIGHGMNTSVRAITEVLNGSMLVASRGGLCHVTPKEKKFITIKDDSIVRGTLICIRYKKGEFDLEKYRECIYQYRKIDDYNIVI